MTADWDNSFELARQLASAPSAAPWLELLRKAQPKWEGKVGVKPSIVDYLLFHRLYEAFPWETFVAVSDHTDGGHGSGATPENGYAVLDAFLLQLTGTA